MDTDPGHLLGPNFGDKQSLMIAKQGTLLPADGLTVYDGPQKLGCPACIGLAIQGLNNIS